MGSRGPKKGQRFGGRQKGTPNKLPRDLKLRILTICDKLDEEGKSLYDCAKNDPPWFYVNFLKPILPKNVELAGGDGGPIETKMVNMPPEFKTIDEWVEWNERYTSQNRK